jgi:AhpD family alkylhydroperoxidase
MRRLQALAPAEAPERSRELLEEIIGRRGSVGEMVSTMAHSPALLQGYLDFSRAMKRVKLPRALSEKISLAVQEWIGCAYCLAAHAEVGGAAGLTETDIALARQGTSTDARETALIALALRVLAEPAAITDDEVAEARGHGWSERVIAELVGIVTLNLLTGAFNLLTGIHPAVEPEPSTPIR